MTNTAEIKTLAAGDTFKFTDYDAEHMFAGQWRVVDRVELGVRIENVKFPNFRATLYPHVQVAPQ